MRYFFENLVGLQPQNLIPEVIWLSLGVYLLTIFACYASIARSLVFSTASKLLWSTIILIPFIGPASYATFSLLTAESGWKEFFHPHGEQAKQ